MADSSKEEQARKAQALAEKCFLAGNVSGARQWMQSAVRLAPGLPGSAQAVAAYDVHAAAARRPVDFYTVLGLLRPHPAASRSTGAAAAALTHDDIKRQHRRLCLLVHPDKNPSAAADGAFKLIQAAWEALSARHPPADDTATAAAPTQPGSPPPRPPDPPPRPQPQPRQQRRPPGAHHQGRRPSYADAARAPQPRRPASSPTRAPRVPPPPPASWCPSCGALKPYGKRSLRCMVCHWSLMDQCRVDHDDDY